MTCSDSDGDGEQRLMAIGQASNQARSLSLSLSLSLIFSQEMNYLEKIENFKTFSERSQNWSKF